MEGTLQETLLTFCFYQFLYILFLPGFFLADDKFIHSILVREKEGTIVSKAFSQTRAYPTNS